MIKLFCDICKTELDDNLLSDNSSFKISLPTKNYNVCSKCLGEVKKFLEDTENKYKLENKRYEKDYNNNWKEIY